MNKRRVTASAFLFLHMARGRFLEGIYSLARKLNRADSDYEETQEGVVGEKVSEISLNKSDDDLIVLKKKWEQRWEDSKVKKDIEAKQKENEKYWLGDHFTQAQKKTNRTDPVDNLIFEALETFLPIATRQIAEPTVETSQEPIAQLFAKKVADRIVDVADVIRLRLKVKKAVRYWALYFLGCIKFGWSLDKNEIAVQAIRPQELVLDPDAITDECEYEGEYIGHYRKDSVSDLAARFPGKAEAIKKEVGAANLGTKIRYMEWWTNEYVFWTFKDEVLGKAKNPHWNYDQDIQREVMDEFGASTMATDKVKGNNHFSKAKMPFAFLSVFSLGKGPFDDTNLIEQVLSLQDIVNKRVKQVDRNADNTNGGSVVSGDVFTKEQAREVGEALRKGQTVWVPNGDVNRAYKRDIAPSLPPFIYQHLVDSRNEIRSIFGTTGLSSQGIKSEDTVRGKILVKGTDSDRAALIVDHIEQFYDYIFNWFVQLMMVYYDTPREVSRSQGADTIVSSDFIWPLIVSVKEGSLIPKDRLTQRNEAIDLWSAQAIDPLTLFERLEFPDPMEATKRLIAWKTNPLSLIGAPQGGLQEEQGRTEAEPPQPAESQLLQQVPIQ